MLKYNAKQNIISLNMSNNTNDSYPSITCERFNRHNSKFASCRSGKIGYRPIKKLLPSRLLQPNSFNDGKSCSTGVIRHTKPLAVSQPKNITKSDIQFSSKAPTFDFCTRCGDTAPNTKKSGSHKPSQNILDPLCHEIRTQVSVDRERSKNNVRNKKKMVQEFYKNENFKPSKSSVIGNRFKNSNNNLDPIKETTEGQTSGGTSASILEIYTDSRDEIGFLDIENEKNMEELKDFRKKNYFECHSAKSRISNKGSVTSLTNHKCVYRFYLNDRLFPVPLNMDHHNTIRCIDCHLPLDETNLNSEGSINGTIQAKVKIGDQIQDMILMLPVKKPLIVQEKRKLKDEKDNSVLYFGIVKLNSNGDSIFNRNLPGDSLALRYQKGFKEFVNNEAYRYEKVKEDDVIII